MQHTLQTSPELKALQDIATQNNSRRIINIEELNKKTDRIATGYAQYLIEIFSYQIRKELGFDNTDKINHQKKELNNKFKKLADTLGLKMITIFDDLFDPTPIQQNIHEKFQSTKELKAQKIRTLTTIQKIPTTESMIAIKEIRAKDGETISPEILNVLGVSEENIQSLVFEPNKKIKRRI